MTRRLALICLLAPFLFASGHIMNPDGHLRLAQTRAWVEHHSLSLPPDVGNPAHGNLAIALDGRRFSVHNPGQSIAFIPFITFALLLPPLPNLDPHYVAAFFASFLGPVSHFLTAFILLLFAKDLGRSDRHAQLICLLFAFGTVNFPHSLDTYEHPQEALFVLLCLFLANRSSSQASRFSTTSYALSSGLALGLALLFRNTAILALPSALLLLQNQRQALAFLSGLTPACLLILGYNHLRFGSPLETGYALAWSLAHGTQQDLIAHFSHPLSRGLVGLWLSPGKGLLLFSPILLLCLTGFRKVSRRNRRFANSSILLVTSYSLFYASNFAWHGSAWSWGPRYLIPVVPVMLLWLPPLDQFRAVSRTVAIALVAMTVFFQLAAITVDYRRHLILETLQSPTIFGDDSSLFRPELSPLLAQAICLRELAHKWAAHPQNDYNLLLAPGPWRNEGRPATQELMLESSVDLNVLNFWWARAAYYPISPTVLIGIRIAMAALVSAFIILVSQLSWKDD